MGRVYEALRKSDRRSVTVRPDDVDTSADPALHIQPDDPAAEDFNFVPYSLGAPSRAEMDAIKREGELGFESQRLMTQPAREQELNPQRLDPRLVCSYESSPAMSNEFNKAAIMLMSMFNGCSRKRVLVTSADHGSGKTVTTINLAMSLAKSNKRVLVVDCDFQRPSILRLLGLEAEYGLPEVIRQSRRPGDAAIRIQPSGVTVIPTRGPVDNSGELLSSSEFPALLRMFEQEYDFVLIDSDPLLHSADARLLAPMVDKAVLVISPGKVTASQLSKAIAPLTREQLAGVVMNRVDRRESPMN